MLKLEEHEAHINDLTNFLKVEGVDQAKLSTILQGLRENYTEINKSITDTTNKITSLNELNEGLRNANMTLLSKLGTSVTDLKVQTKSEQKPQQDDVKSLDDIALEFLK